MYTKSDRRPGSFHSYFWNPLRSSAGIVTESQVLWLILRSSAGIVTKGQNVFIYFILFQGSRNTEKVKRTHLLRCLDFNPILNLVHIALILQSLTCEFKNYLAMCVAFRVQGQQGSGTQHMHTKMPLSVRHLNYVREFYSRFLFYRKPLWKPPSPWEFLDLLVQ